MNQSLALNLLKSGRNVFLTGQAGSGKTYVINQYVSWLYRCGIRVALTASTGIAATHIGGVTIHSWSGIGIKDQLTPHDLELIAQKEHIYKAITAAQVLIIDEISMISATILDMVDQVVKHIRQDYRAFGGLQIIVVGDFFQLPPVTKGQTKDFAFAAKSWGQAQRAICYLNTQHRQTDDQLTNILNEIRTGQASDTIISQLTNRIGQRINHQDPIRLYTHNIDVDRINLAALDELETEEVDYEMKAAGDPHFVKLLKNQISSSDFLTLKIGAKVIFIKNNPVKGYYNGTTGIVTGRHNKDRRPIVELRNGTSIKVEPEIRSIEDANTIVASVTQLPLKLARAITIHKSQGMTLDAAEVDLSKSFEAGQAYVALSRVKSLNGLQLIGLNLQGLTAHPLVLRGDTYFQTQSHILENDHQTHSDADRSQIHQSYISVLGGTYHSDDENTPPIIKTLIVKQPKSKTQKGDTLLITLDLIKQHKTLSEICTIRQLTESTIIGHLVKIKTMYPDISLKLYKPDNILLVRFRKALAELSKNTSNINEAGYVTSTAIYKYFGGEISYATIKLCGLFI